MDRGSILLQKIEEIKEKLKNEEDGGRKEGLEKDLSAWQSAWDYYVKTEEELARSQELELVRIQEELGRNKLSRTVWLQQTLPRMQLAFGGKPGARKENLDYAPTAFIEWSSFRQDVQGMLEATEEDAVSFERFSWRLLDVMEGSNERSVTYFSAQVFMQMMAFLFPELKIMCSPSKRKSVERSSNVSADSFTMMELSCTSGGYCVDHLVVRGEIELLAVKVKSPSAFRNSERERPADLVEQYQKFRVDGSNALTGDIIRQAVLYMDLCKLRYCVITSVDSWYFLKWRIDEASNTFTCLEISSAVTYDSENPTVLQSLYYFMTVANEEAEKFSNYHFNKMFEVLHENKTSSGKAKRKGSPGDFEGKRYRSKSDAGDTGNELGDVLKETLASNLHCKIVLASGGWSGNVVCGMVEGQKAAIKLAPRFSSRAEALINEVTAYKQLRMYWGQYIPDLLAYGTTAHGKVVFMATKFIDGRSISQERLNDATAVAAREALTAIHGADILHGDIHNENILVVRGGVRFVDFGFARLRPNEEERRREWEKLEGILQSMIPRST